MNRTCFLLTAGVMCGAGMPAQAQSGVEAYRQAYPQVVTPFQQAQSLGEPLGQPGGRGGRGGAVNSVPILRAETGKPFSATVTTQTTQTFLDGTHVRQATATVQYRDAEGRTRIERSEPGVSVSGPVKSITIRDPVAGVSYNLDPAEKTAVKLTMAGNPIGPANPAAAGGRGGRGGGRGDPSEAIEQLQQVLRLPQLAEAARNNQNSIEEDLGTATVNGVPASGTRITTVVPVGAIGNDKEFRSVTERWFSPDLNLLIKSVSTDPRFGTTTYEVTNISRQAPDPSLFQPPADYNIVYTPPAPPAPKVIDELEFRGVRGISPDTLRATIRSKVGDVFDEEALRRDVAALWKTNLFEDVQLDVQLKPDSRARGGVIVRFVVTQRP
jgi:hypothetical protein